MKIMFKVKLSNNEIVTFISKDELLQYISENWSVQAYQIVIKDKHIYLVGKLGNVFAVVGIIE